MIPLDQVQKRKQECCERVNSLDKACHQYYLYYSKYKHTKARKPVTTFSLIKPGDYFKI